MAQYIDKDALVAWTLEELKLAEKFYKETGSDVYFGKINLLKKQLSFLDSLEVKEVDLNDYYHKFLEKEWFGNRHVRTVSEMMAFTAKHFFELGMAVSNKAQKGE